MTSSLLAAAVALTLGLPIFAIGEYLREGGERSPNCSPSQNHEENL